jgi:hypothetical protein
LSTLNGPRKRDHTVFGKIFEPRPKTTATDNREEFYSPQKNMHFGSAFDLLEIKGGSIENKFNAAKKDLIPGRLLIDIFW